MERLVINRKKGASCSFCGRCIKEGDSCWLYPPRKHSEDYEEHREPGDKTKGYAPRECLSCAPVEPPT